MALGSNDLSLLFRMRGQYQAGPAFKAAHSDLAQLKGKVGAEFGQMQGVATTALSKITQSLGQFGGQIPVVGTAVNALSGTLGTLTTSSAGASAGLAAVAAPAAAVAIGLAVTTSAVIALVQGLFSLAQAAAEFRGKMLDLSQQTGVAVETLSTLEVVAKTTGGNIDGIAQSLVIFQRHLDDAQDSSTDAGKRFKELGISTRNTEDAFRDALTVLAKMPEGFHQTNEAAELFGARGGKQVLALLKEMDGDLDGTTARLRKMGLVISEEDAKAADEFNDQLAILQFQFRALLGQDVIPAALTALKTLSEILANNQEAINALGKVIGLFSNVVLSQFLEKLNQVNIALAALEIAAAALDKITGTDTRFRGLTSGVGSEDRLGGLTGGAGAVERASGSGRTVRGGKSEAQRELEQQLALFQQLQNELGKVTNEFLGVETASREYAITQELVNGALEKAAPGLQQMALSTAKDIDAVKKQIALNKELKTFQDAQNAAIKLAIEGEETHIEAAERVIKSLESQGRQLSVAELHWLRFNAAVLQSVEAMEKAIASALDLETQHLGPLGVEGDGTVLPGFDVDLGLPPPGPEFDAWKEAFEGLREIGTNAMQDLAFGIGNLAQNWVLLGNIGPQAVRKMVAATLAGVAAESAVRAVFELARGFAALFTNPAEAAAHFTSAAIFGSIAGVAAVAGRTVAGGAFQQQVSGSGGSRSVSSGGSSTPATIDVDRKRAGGESQTISRVLEFKVKGDAVVERFVEDFQLNGRTRVIINSDGQG